MEFERSKYSGVNEPEVPYDNFYSKIMHPRDILANILKNLSDPEVSGITWKFGVQGDKDMFILGITDSCYPSDQVLKDMVATMNEVIKYIKKKYKEVTGVNLKLKKIAESSDNVGAYTVDKKALISFFVTFDISTNKDEAEMNSLDREINPDDDKRKRHFGVA